MGNRSGRVLYPSIFYPDGSRGRRAKSIAFASMDETEFQQVYKAVLNVLWNWILFRKIFLSGRSLKTWPRICWSSHENDMVSASGVYHPKRRMSW
ncbi:IrsA [Salmonella enterica subsp. enterica serovar Typhimurium]|nr:IrsA [Salmonella enterica subsp. enterica serovar Typhimurium]